MFNRSDLQVSVKFFFWILLSIVLPFSRKRLWRGEFGGETRISVSFDNLLKGGQWRKEGKREAKTKDGGSTERIIIIIRALCLIYIYTVNVCGSFTKIHSFVHSVSF